MGIHPLTITISFLILAAAGMWAVENQNRWIAFGGAIVVLLVLLTLRVAQQWQKAVVLRIGKFQRLQEETLTMDSVPVDVDAVLFWRVIDAQKAALEVESYREAIAWASQTALRDVLGESDLSDILIGRRKIDARLCEIIDARTEAWGIKALAVEIRDVKIPTALQDAMSMQAQAERERQARVILADSERQIAARFAESAEAYRDDPVALHLRAMNILLEGMRQNSTVIIVPSSAVETMGLGAMTGVTPLAKEFAPLKHAG